MTDFVLRFVTPGARESAQTARSLSDNLAAAATQSEKLNASTARRIALIARERTHLTQVRALTTSFSQTDVAAFRAAAGGRAGGVGQVVAGRAFAEGLSRAGGRFGAFAGGAASSLGAASPGLAALGISSLALAGVFQLTAAGVRRLEAAATEAAAATFKLRDVRQDAIDAQGKAGAGALRSSGEALRAIRNLGSEDLFNLAQGSPELVGPIAEALTKKRRSSVENAARAAAEIGRLGIGVSSSDAFDAALKVPLGGGPLSDKDLMAVLNRAGARYVGVTDLHRARAFNASPGSISNNLLRGADLLRSNEAAALDLAGRGFGLQDLEEAGFALTDPRAAANRKYIEDRDKELDSLRAAAEGESAAGRKIRTLWQGVTMGLLGDGSYATQLEVQERRLRSLAAIQGIPVPSRSVR